MPEGFPSVAEPWRWVCGSKGWRARGPALHTWLLGPGEEPGLGLHPVAPRPLRRATAREGLSLPKSRPEKSGSRRQVRGLGAFAHRSDVLGLPCPRETLSSQILLKGQQLPDPTLLPSPGRAVLALAPGWPEPSRSPPPGQPGTCHGAEAPFAAPPDRPTGAGTLRGRAGGAGGAKAGGQRSRGPGG